MNLTELRNQAAKDIQAERSKIGSSSYINNPNIPYNEPTLADRRYTGLAPYGEPTKAEKLLEARNEKINRLHALTSTSSGAQLQQALSDIVDQQVYTDANGNKYQEMYGKDSNGNTTITKVPYTKENAYGNEDTRNLYIDNTLEGNMKLGLARSDKGFLGRYTPTEDSKGKKYGWTPGPKGVTPQDGALMDIQLPYNVATQFEHGVHSNRGQLANRAIGQGPVSKQDIANFGSGKTEYTTQNAPMWNQSANTNPRLAPNTPLPKEMDKLHKYQNGLQITDSNLIDALQYGVGRKAAGIADAIVDAGGQVAVAGYGMMNPEMTQEQVQKKMAKTMGGNSFTKDYYNKNGDFIGLDKYKKAAEYGYDDATTQAAMADFGKAFDSGSPVEMAKSIARNLDAAPEFIAESAGEFLTGPMRAAGVILNTFDYANKTLERRQEETGKAYTTLGDKALAGLTGWGQAILNKAGVDEMIGRTKIVSGVMDKLIKSNKLTDGMVLNAGKRLAGALTVATGKGLYEGTEEVAQQFLDIVGAKLGDEKANEIFSSKTGRELFQAFGGGFGSGAGMHVVTSPKETIGAVLSPVMATTNKGLTSLAEISANRTVADIDARKAKEYIAKQNEVTAAENAKIEEIKAQEEAVTPITSTTTADTLDLTREDISTDEINSAATDLVTKTIQAQEAGTVYEPTVNEQAFQAAYGEAVNAKFTEVYADIATNTNTTNAGLTKATPKQMSEGSRKLNDNPELAAQNTVLDKLSTKVSEAKTEVERTNAEVAYNYHLNNVVTPLINSIRGFDDAGNLISTVETSSATTPAKGTPTMAVSDRTSETIQQEIEELGTSRDNTYVEDLQRYVDNGMGIEEAKKKAHSNSRETFNKIKALEEELKTVKANEVSQDKAFKEQGISDDDLTIYKNAGIANIISVDDRAKGLGIEIDTDKVQLKEGSTKKNKLYDPMKADNATLDSIIESGFNKDTIDALDVSNKGSTFLQRLSKHFTFGKEKQVELTKIAKDITAKLSNPTVKEAMTKVSGTDTSTAQALRAITVAVSAVRSATTAEFDITHGEGAKHNGYAPQLGLAEQVGKAYLNSFGAKLKGKDSESMAAKHKEIGMNVLKLAEAAGYVESASNMSFQVHNRVTPKGDRVSTSRDGGKSDIPVGQKSGTFANTGYRVKGDKDSSRIPENAVGSTLSSLDKIFNPINEEMVMSTPSDVVTSKNPISKEHQQIIKDMQGMKFRIKAPFIELLKSIKASLGDNMEANLSTNPDIKKLLGLDKKSTLLTKMGDSGKSIQRKGNLLKLLENLDELEAMSKDGFHFTLDTAINERVHIMQTLLEFQGDKFMSRQILTGGEYTTGNKYEYDMLINDIKDNLPKGMEYNDDRLTAAVKDFNKGVFNGDQAVFNIVATMKALGFDSPFKMLNVLQGMADVQKADGYKVTTEYVPSADATASGVMNTLMNLIGMPSIQNMFNNWISGGKFDPYTALLDAVDLDKEGSFSERALATNNVFNILYKGSNRDITKYPIIKWIYGQWKGNTEREMADSIAVDLLKAATTGNQDALNEVNRILATANKEGYEDILVGDIAVRSGDAHLIKEAEELEATIKDGNYVIFDTETTDSTQGKNNHIIQASIRIFKNGVEQEPVMIHVPLEDGITISQGAFEIHKVSEEILKSKIKNGETRKGQIAKIRRAIGSLPIIAHSASFDTSALQLGDGKIITNKVHDTMALAKIAQYEKAAQDGGKTTGGVINIKALSKTYGIEYDDKASHDAAYDTAQTKLLIQPMLDRFNSVKSKLKVEGANNISNLTEEDKKVITDYYQTNISSLYVPALDKAFPGVKEYSTAMKTLYGILQTSKVWDGRIKSAMGVMQGTGNKMSVRKLKNVVQDVDGDLTQIDKEMDNETSFLVNLQHSVDAALLLLSMQKVLNNPNLTEVSVMTVHDDFRAQPKVLREIMAEYNKLTREVAVKYDFLSVAMDEVQEVIEKLEAKENKTPEEIKTLSVVKAQYNSFKNDRQFPGTDGKLTVNEMLEAKKKFLEGDIGLKVLGDKTVDLSGVDTSVSKHKAKEKAAQTLSEKLHEALNNGADVATALQSVVNTIKVSEEYGALKQKVLDALSGKTITFSRSDQGFTGGNGKVTIPTGKIGEERFVASAQRATAMTPEGLIETLAHEIDHAYKLSYIESDTGLKSPEVKYLNKVVEKLRRERDKGNLTTLSSETQARIKYIVEHKDAGRAVSELVSVLENEISVSNEIKGIVQAPTLLEVLSNLIKRVKEWVKAMTQDERKSRISEAMSNDDTTMMALEASLIEVSINSKAYGVGDGKAMARASAKSDTDTVNDPYFNENLNPLVAANKAMAKSNRFLSDWMIIWGDLIAQEVGPIAGKFHNKMKEKYPVYVQTMSMIRSGFYESEWMQKMHTNLGVDGSRSEVINKLQTLRHEIGQQTGALARKMAELKRRQEEVYTKKERNTLYAMFKTGIGHLSTEELKTVHDGIFNGSMTYKEAIAIVSDGMTADQIRQLDNVANYVNTGNTTETAREVNTLFIEGVSEEKGGAYVALKALSQIPGSLELLKGMDKDMLKEMLSIANANKHLSEVINRAKTDYTGKKITNEAGYYSDYDVTYAMDIFNENHEYVLITAEDLKRSIYSETNGWFVVKGVENGVGLVGRKSYSPTNRPGVGLEVTRYQNGVYLDPEQSAKMDNIIGKLKSKEAVSAYLDANSITMDNGKYRFVIDEKTKREKLDLVEDSAESLYRTYIRNFELVHAQSIKDIVLNEGIQHINTEKDMLILNTILETNNKERGLLSRTKVLPFLKVNYDMKMTYDEMAKKYPYIAMYFRTPNNLSTYQEFNQNITFVKKGEGDVLLGYKPGTLFADSDNRSLAKWESMYKKLIVLSKQKMIVTNPKKLAVDAAANMGILSMYDMDPMSIFRGMKDGFTEYHKLTAKRNTLVDVELKARIAFNSKDTAKYEVLMKRRDKINAQLKEMKFYDAWKSGFIQSYSTDLVLKEFDTISGIQRDIDIFIDKYTIDEKGDPNALYKAIKWWQEAGGPKANVETFFSAVSKASALKGTMLSTELKELSERLKNKKNEESVARYVSEFLGSPSSEVVSYGSATMVLIDALSKYLLANHLMTQENPRKGKVGARPMYTKEEAYAIAQETFIDYRDNLPKEVQTLSDYGVLLFPAYWMRVQKILAGLALYHPISSLGGFAIEASLGIESMSAMNSNLFTKGANEGLINLNPAEVIDAGSVMVLL